MVTYDPSIPAIAPTLTERRLEAALDRDVNVARIADALERIADVLEVYREPDTGEDEGDERTQDPGPDDAPASPEDWAPRKGGRALLPLVNGPVGIELVPVVVDRLYVSEGVLMAHVVTEDGLTATRPAASLSEPRP